MTDEDAPYRAPMPAAPRPPDAMGWALVATPALAAVIQIVLPWPLVGALVGTCGVVASIVLIGVDAKRWNQQGAGHVTKAILFWAICFPLYVRRRALWGPPNRLPFAVLAVLLFLVGSFFHPFAIQNRANVRCHPVGKTLDEGFDCAIERTGGPDPIEACWDLSLTCANGPGGDSHACGSAPPGAVTHVPMAYASFAGAHGCDKVTAAELKNLSLRVE